MAMPPSPSTPLEGLQDTCPSWQSEQGPGPPKKSLAQKGKRCCARIPVLLILPLIALFAIACAFVVVGPVTMTAADTAGSNYESRDEISVTISGVSNTCPDSIDVKIIALVTQVNPSGSTITVSFHTVVGSALSSGNSILNLPLSTSLVVNYLGNRVTYANNSIPQPVTVTTAISPSGTKSTNFFYPFDRYTTLLLTSAFLLGANGTQTAISLCSTIGLSAATFTAQATGYRGQFDQNTAATGAIAFTIQRSGSTVFASMLIVILMWCVSGFIFGLAVDNVFLRPREPAGPTVGFFISTIFSFPSIRNTQPNVPPVGSLVDWVGFFWNVVLLLVAALLMLSAFVGYHVYPGRANFRYW